MENNILIKFENIYKYYPGVVALDDVDLELKKGEIHGLVGKNGAGKSTFVDIMYGATKADSGQAYISKNGMMNPIELHSFSPVAAREMGIYLVPQEPPFALDLTIEENFYLQNPVMKKKLVMDRRLMKKKVTEALEKFGLSFDPDTHIYRISMEDRHLVYTALVTELYDGDIILLDEVTSALRKSKTEKLFEYMNRIKNEKAIVLITHRIPEIFELCDMVTVFRDGKKITTDKVSNMNSQLLSDLIVGESVKKPQFEEKFYCKKTDKKELLRVEGFTAEPFFRNINFSLNPGEILGITGLVESGATQLFRSIAGVMNRDHGELEVRGRVIEKNTPEIMLEENVVYGTNDRIHEGSFNDLSVLENLNAGIWDKLFKKGRISKTDEKRNYEKYQREYNIKCNNMNNNIMTLSGGNQQKVILGRLAATEPRVLILDEPTKGIDVGAKYEILKLLRMNLVGEEGNNGVILNSSSIEELMLVCDRILIMVNGSLVKDFLREDFDERNIFKAIQGV